MSKLRVIVQARTESARLPGKALLPIAGMPSAILAARRAANQGHDVVLATSREPADDALAATAQRAGLAVFRGSHDNVRERFLEATGDLADQDIIVRLTADNMLPDGSLLMDLLSQFQERRTAYLSIDQIWDRPPYGLSCEMFLRGALKKVSATIDTPHEQEHVTPALRDLTTHEVPRKVFSSQESALRVTMDNLADYQKISLLFAGIADPVTISWRRLVARMAGIPDVPVKISPGPGFVLGTAQLAAPYGSVVKVAPPEPAIATTLVRQAIVSGVLALDTARDYPGSETAIGRALAGGWSDRVPVMTKLSALQHLSDEAPAEEAVLAAETSVVNSLHHLGGQIRPHLMLHRAAHLQGWGGAVMNRLVGLRQEGIIKELGASVQTPEEAQIALSHPEISLLQIPFNVLDKRWARAGIPEQLAARPEVKIYIRSTFLQGILLRDERFWPKINGVNPLNIIKKLKEAAQEMNRDHVADLCISYVRSHPWITGLVIGMETLPQLHENIQFFTRPILTSDEAKHLDRLLPEVPENLVNPALWPRPNA